MILKIYDNPNEKVIREVCDHLRKGEIIIFPTDTIYAIGCALGNHSGVDTLVKLKHKQKPGTLPSLLCKDLSQASSFIKPLSGPCFKLVKKHLPGPYTFIFETSTKVSKIFMSKRKTIGIRIPDNPITLAILEELDSPIVSISIHDADDIIEYSTNPELIQEKYKTLASLVIDGGLGGTNPSAVIDLSSGEPVVLREGPSPFIS